MSSIKEDSAAEKVDEVKERDSQTATKEGDEEPGKETEVKEENSDDAARETDSEQDQEKEIKQEEETEEDDKEKAVVKRKRSTLDSGADGGDDGSPAGKRRRKTSSAAAYKPDDFSEKKPKAAMKGRGDSLRDIPSTKASIESYKLNSEAMLIAYRFLFVTRGKIPTTARAQLLDFSGYIPDIDDDEDKDDPKLVQQEEIIEERYAKKAYKLTIPQLRTMCEFFDIDRSPAPGERVDKDVMIERLLDFLSAPTEEETHAYGREHNITRKPIERAPNTEKSADEETSDGEDEDEEEDDDNKESQAERQGKLGALPRRHELKMPDDKILRTWVRAYVACHNMSTATLRHAVEIATGKFGVDMKTKKETLKMLITEEC